MNETIQSALLGLVTGDALGVLFDGFSKGHVSSFYKMIEKYEDTRALCDDRPDNWRKPGLYGYISQMSIIAAALGSERPSDSGYLISFIEEKGRVLQWDSGVFRVTQKPEMFFLSSIYKSPSVPLSHYYPSGSAAIISAMANISLCEYAPPDPIEILVYARIVGGDVYSGLAAYLISVMSYRVLALDLEENILGCARNAQNEIVDELAGLSPELFEKGFNPDRVSEAAKLLFEILGSISDTVNESEKGIVRCISPLFKSPITRATIDHAFGIVPLSIVLVHFHSSEAPIKGSLMGGTSSAVASCAGFFTGLFYPNEALSWMIDSLVNRRSMCTVIENISSGTAGRVLANSFFDGEIPLTDKEHAERISIFGQTAEISQSAKKSNPTDRMTRHVVESWTKIDKAKWRKTQKKLDDHYIDDSET